jgi:hypothetical protein
MTITFLYDNREASTVTIVPETLAEVLAVEVPPNWNESARQAFLDLQNEVSQTLTGRCCIATQEVCYGYEKNFNGLRYRPARAYLGSLGRSYERDELAGHNATNTDRAGPLLLSASL